MADQKLKLVRESAKKPPVAQTNSPSCFLRPYEDAMVRTFGASHVNVPRMWHRAAATAMLGGLLTKQDYRVRVAVGVDPMWTNLWVMLIGPTGSGKSTCINATKKILKQLEPTLIAASESTSEAMIKSLSQEPATVVYQAEFTHMLFNMDKQYMRSYKTLMIDLYDASGDLIRETMKGGRVFVPNPRATLLAGIAEELLARHSSAEDWLGGFFNRCLMIPWFHEFPDNDGDLVIDDAEITRLGAGLRAALDARKAFNDAHEHDVVLRASPKLRDIIKAKIPKLPEEPHLAASLTRIRAHLYKIAAIEQFDEDPESTTIGEQALLRAFELVDFWRERVPDLIQGCFVLGRADFEGNRLSKSVLRYLEKVGTWVQTDLVVKECGLDPRVVDAIDFLHKYNEVGKWRDTGPTDPEWVILKRLMKDENDRPRTRATRNKD